MVVVVVDVGIGAVAVSVARGYEVICVFAFG